MLILAIELLCFTLKTMAHWSEMFGFPYDPEKTYYNWHFLWYGNGGAFDIDFILYDSYEKNGKTYQKMWVMNDTKDGEYLVDLGWYKHMIGIRVEDGRIYADRDEYLNYLREQIQKSKESPNEYGPPVGSIEYVPYRHTDDGELILYDFTMQPGDKFPSFVDHEDIIVTYVEEMTTRDGVRRRLLTLNNGYKLLEGVGCLNSPGMFYFYLNPSEEMIRYYSTTSMTYFNCFGKNGGEIYKKDDENTVGIRVAKEESIKRTDIYNLFGLRLSAPPSRGFYIKNGKKVFVR